MSDELLQKGRRVSDTAWPHKSPVRTGFARKALGVLFGSHFLALADQAVVSGASFVTTVLVGRWSSPGELGRYSIVISLVILAMGVQESLIALPYTIQRNRPDMTAKEHAGGTLALSGLMSALVTILAAAALIVMAGALSNPMIVLGWTLAALAPFMLLREFARRFAFAHLRVEEALVLDLGTATFQIGGLIALAWAGWLSAATACGAIGAACMLTGVLWLFLSRAKFSIRSKAFSTISKHSWDLGKWLFASQLTVSVQTYVAFWILGFTAGAPAAGVYAACMSIASLSNPLVSGLGNILLPRAVMSLRESGIKELRRQAALDALLLGTVMACFTAAVVLTGDDVLRLLFHDRDFDAPRNTIMVLALAISVSALGVPASNALASIEKPRAIFWAGFAGAAITAIISYWLAAMTGIEGAAYGFFFGNIVGAAGRWLAFLATARVTP